MGGMYIALGSVKLQQDSTVNPLYSPALCALIDPKGQEYWDIRQGLALSTEMFWCNDVSYCA